MDERPPGSRERGRARRPPEAHRLVDLPQPRRSKGMLAPAFRTIFTWPYRIGLAGLYRAGFRAWQLTILSLATNVVIGWLLIRGHFFVSGLLLIVAGVFDIFDGGVARLRGEASRAGAFLDSVMDRISDVVLFSCLFWALAGQRHRLAAALGLSSLIVTLLISHIRAEAEAMDLALTEGLMQRLERYVLLMVGLTAPGALVPVLAVITGLGALTVAQRADSAWRQLRRRERAGSVRRRRPAQKG